MGSEARGIGVESPWGRNGVRIFSTQQNHLIPFLPRSLSWHFTFTLCVLPDAGGRGAEGGAPESAGWDCGYDVGCPRVRGLLLCRVEDGEAAATITGPVMKRAASHPGSEVGNRGERAASSENHVFFLWDQSPPSPETQNKPDPTPQFHTAPGLQPKFKEGRWGYLPKLNPVGNIDILAQKLLRAGIWRTGREVRIGGTPSHPGPLFRVE